MLKKKSSSSEKKRKHSQSEERRDNTKRRGTESIQEDSKDELADAELDRISSDIEDGGLDLSMPFKPITAYLSDKQEMLEQCLRVLGDKKLRKMLPDELKRKSIMVETRLSKGMSLIQDCTSEEIKKLCWEQLEPISDQNLIQILTGEELTSGNGDKDTKETTESQQDNNVDSTSCLKEAAKTEDSKQEGGGSSEESDVLSINADTYDSDIEGPKEEQTAKAADVGVKVADSSREGAADPPVNADAGKPEPSVDSKPVEAKKDIQNDIDKSVSEILAFSSTNKEQSTPQQPVDLSAPVQSGSVPGRVAAACQPSIQQLELLELEMRARAIKALMKASDGKKTNLTKTM